MIGAGGELPYGAHGQPSSGFTHDSSRHHYVGRHAGVSWFVERADPALIASAPDAVSAREFAFEAGLQEVLWAGCAVLAWHDTRPSCDRCGGPTEPAQGGFVRICTQCRAELYPRTDPAMIVAVLDSDDRLLLANNRARVGNRRSILAGFVEAGESIEACVVREVGEESGLQVTSLRYLSSQPWPFPRSLMLGYVARADGEPIADQEEITAIDWYSRQDLDAALAADELTLPGPASIARRLIDAWRDGRLRVDLLDQADPFAPVIQTHGA